MKTNSKGIFKDISFRKVGCNWGSGNPSFYEVLKRRKITLSHDRRGRYSIGDLILVAEGFTVIALALVTSPPIQILSNPDLVKELKQYKVNDFKKVYYYKVEFHELPQEDRFLYELQKGLVRIQDEATKKQATKVWKKIKSKEGKDRRLMRITWNSNNWETPCGHNWNPKHQGNSDVAYEKQYGYGHEEWLFNERFRIDGYQYGYIRGAEMLKKDVEFVDQICLFTIREDKQRCLVGNLYNVDIIEGYEPELKKIMPLYKKYHNSMAEELKRVNADFEYFQRDNLLPNVKFKWEDADILYHPAPVDFLSGSEYNRFNAYLLKPEKLQKVASAVKNSSKFVFQAGKASHTTKFSKKTSKKETKVTRRHGEMTDDLFEYLLWSGLKEKNISVEMTRVGGAIADVVVKEKNGFTFYEVKTSNTALKNIREALGQIFEYALLDPSVKVKDLVIVGPAKLKAKERDYLKRLNSIISLNLEYWAYLPDEKLIENKFEKA